MSWWAQLGYAAGGLWTDQKAITGFVRTWLNAALWSVSLLLVWWWVSGEDDGRYMATSGVLVLASFAVCIGAAVWRLRVLRRREEMIR